MQQTKKFGTMRNKYNLLKTTKNTNPVARALMSTELNVKPKVVPNKKKYNRGKEKKTWQTI